MAEIQLSERTAVKYVGEREWQKGRPYISGLTGLTQQPDGETTILQGNAHGQEKYAVRVVLREGEILDANCTCPVGSGTCKHVAALLARAVQAPGDFNALPDLGSILDHLEAPELRKLVRLMLQREPELMRLVLTQPRNTASVDGRNDLGQRIESAFSLIDYDLEEDWEGEGPDLSDLYPLVDEANALLTRVHALDNQGQVDLLEAFLAVLSGCGEMNDDGYDLGLNDLYEPARTGLLKLLHTPLDEFSRENALDGLLESIGDLGWSAGEFDRQHQRELFSELPAGDRQVVIQFVRKLMDAAREPYLKERWARTVRFLSAGEHLSFDEELSLARATGDQEDVVQVLFKHERIEEAIQALSAGRNRVAPQEVEHLFRERDLMPRLEEYAQQNLKVFGSRAWLYQRYRETGRNAQAHALARQAVLKGTGEHDFYTSAFLVKDLDWLSELKTVSPDWPADRAEYIRKLWKSLSMTAHLMRFLLEENLLDEAQKLARQNEHVPPGLLNTLAQRLPAEQAKPLLLKAAVKYVAEGNRTNYALAAQVLSESIPLVGREEARAMARLLLQNHPRLRALPEELKKVGLA